MGTFATPTHTMAARVRGVCTVTDQHGLRRGPVFLVVVLGLDPAVAEACSVAVPRFLLFRELQVGLRYVDQDRTVSFKRDGARKGEALLRLASIVFGPDTRHGLACTVGPEYQRAEDRTVPALCIAAPLPGRQLRWPIPPSCPWAGAAVVAA
jgi:hypothetical protein